MTKKYTYILFTLLLLNTSCKKNDTGGKATVTAYTAHHGKPINLPTIYVKFGAKDMPSDPTNNYDLKLQGVHENHIHIKDLRYGHYFIYATGFDSSIMLPVTGGVPIEIKWKDRKNNGIEIDVPVTE